MIEIEINGVRKALRSHGITDCKLTKRSLQADILDLTIEVQAIASGGLSLAFDSPVSVWDGTEALFHGRIQSTSFDFDAPKQSLKVRVENIWADLALIFLQQAKGLNGPEWSGQVRIATNETQEITSISRAANELISYAKQKGIDVSISGDLFGDCPAIRGHNQTVADLLRTVFRWAPDRVLVAKYGNDGSTALKAIANSDDADVTLEIAGESLPLRPRFDLVPDSVHVIYELSAPEYYIEDGSLKQRTANKSVREWAGNGSITRRSVVIALQGNAPQQEPLETGSPGNISNTTQPITTRPLPRSGATNEEARRWWLDHMGLAGLGLTVAQVLLPVADKSSMNIRKHRIWIAPEDRDTPPSVLTKGAKPSFRPSTLDDLPRELVNGQIAEWMGVYATKVNAEATLAVAKVSVDALPPSEKEAVLNMTTQKQISVGGVLCYLIQCAGTVMGTDARTKLYSTLDGYTGAGGLPSQETIDAWNKAAFLAALSVIRVDGLASRLWDSMNKLGIEGSLTNPMQEDFPLAVGMTVSFDAEAWEGTSIVDAVGVVRESSIDYLAGTVTTSFGPPDHLGAAALAALADAARAQVERERSAAVSYGWSGLSNDWRKKNEPIEGASFSPVSDFRMTGGGSGGGGYWEIEIIDGQSGSFKISNPGKIYASYSVLTALSLTGVGSGFTASSGMWLAIRATIDADPEADPTLELVMISEPSGGKAYKFDGKPPRCTEGLFPLYIFGSGAAPSDGIQINDYVHAVRVDRGGSLVAAWAAHRLDDDYTHLAVPVLIPL